MKHSLRLALVTALIALVVTSVLSFLEIRTPAIRLLNLKGRDFFFRLKHDLFQAPRRANEIALVTVDDESLRRITSRWPYPRSFYADALRNLKKYEPRAIGFDLVFSGEDFSPESDQIFAAGLKEVGNVVIATHWTPGGEVGPSDFLRNSAAATGVVDKPRDRDRVIRRAYTNFSTGKEMHLSWELELLKLAFPDQEKMVPFGRPLLINYALKFNEFNQIPFWKALEGKVSRDEVKDKVLLVGLTSEAFHDIHASPLGSMPGLAINGNFLLTMMTQTFYSVPSKLLYQTLAFLGFWMTLLATVTGTIVSGGLAVLGLILLYLFVGFTLFSTALLFDPWLIVFFMFLLFLTTMIFREGQLFLENLKLREESSRDPLTGFYSRRFLELKLKAELTKFSLREKTSGRVKEVSVIMIDLDNFKLVNDSFGHQEGDRVLRTMAEAIRGSVRKDELICRYGGDEFCVILINTIIENAIKFAEKLRTLIAEHPDLAYRTASGVGTVRVTASIGIASVSGVHALDASKLLKAADNALYRAKQGGRNKVCVFDPAQDKVEPDKTERT